jgi:hypothetical protein
MQKADSQTFDAPVANPAPLSSTLPSLGPLGLAARARRAVERMGDRQLATAIGALLFALSAWPLALTEVPPYQDLPNHLAAITVIDHPSAYPEFVSNGFFKTNAALFTWLYFASKLIPAFVAAKIFALGTLLLNALVLPRVVLDLTGSRKKLVVATFFMWPMIHNWFVSMGMLDFALGIPLSLLTILLLNRQARAPSIKNAFLIAFVAAATWYAHVFALMVALLLVLIHAATRASWRDRLQQVVRLGVPLAPVGALVLWSLYTHATEPDGAMHGWVRLEKILPPWELFYNLWAEFLWGFTKLSISSFVVAVGLGVIAWYRRHEQVPFFSPLAFLILGVLYFFLPYTTTNWFHVNSRFIPFLWICAIVRVPETLPQPKKAFAFLGLAAVLYSLGMGVDFVRLEKDRQKFIAGISAVPQNARLLPLLFRRQITSENTRSLLHAWGFYVTEKQVSAPLLFAHSRSFPVMYNIPPNPRFNHLILESFAPSMGNDEWMCTSLRAGGVLSDCEQHWRQRWEEFWRDALPLYDHVLVWDPTPGARELVPSAYRVKFHSDRLWIYERAQN